MKRLMRLRASQHLRDLCAETEFNRAQLIQPFFVVEGLQSEEAIAGLRGNVRHNIPSALRQIEKDLSDGVTQFLLFPVPAEKRARGFDHRSTHKTISEIRRQFGSNFYGPFRNAADSAPQFGDRRHYQLDVRNSNDAIAASRRCAEEGADLLMVKPGMTSLDLIRPIHEQTGRQVGAYQVSGEYGGMALLAEQGLIKFEEALLETWHVFKRAGAQFVISYGARYAKQLGVGR